MPTGIYVRTKENSKQCFKKGHKVPLKWRINLSKINKGKKRPLRTKEWCKNISLSNKGKPKRHSGSFKEGCKHLNWKGGIAKYGANHNWVRKLKGKPNHCEICGTTEKRMYHWTNIDHTYKRVSEDYISMCVPCHKQYDKRNNQKKM